MKRIVFIVCVLIVVALTCGTADASPGFVTPNMIRRNGLTDEQYELLWSQGKNPQIEQAAARDWIFRSSRYQNVTNWLDICGRTNDFAALSYKLQGDNFILVETNSLLRSINYSLEREVQRWIGETETYSNMLSIVEGQLGAATAKIAEEIASLQEEKTDLEAKIADSKYILLRPWLKTKLTAVEARIRVLQALTSSL